MIKLKQLTFALLVAVAAPQLSAQEIPEATDTTYRFRFVMGKDMFYIPWKDNGAELDRLLKAIDRNRSAIDNGRTHLWVKSYGITGNQTMSADSVAYICRNRVKSELIVRGNIKEQHFITGQAYAEPLEGQRNLVVVTLPAGMDETAERLAATKKAEAEQAARAQAAQEQAERDRMVAEQATRRQEAERAAAEQAERERQVSAEQTHLQAESTQPYTLALRTNLLRWATLTPDLGIEWRINRHVGILVNGSWTSWSWNDKDRRYALWEVAPEVRRYLGKENRGYIGAMYKAGSFNYKLSETGKQGDLMGGGITGGYLWQLNKALAIDFNLGLGYIHADYEKYNVTDGVRVSNGKETKNWWGPVHAGVTLTWNLF